MISASAVPQQKEGYTVLLLIMMVKVMRKAVMTTVMMITPVHGNIGGGDEVILRNDTDDCHTIQSLLLFIF